MKLMHISDLHLGRRFGEMSLAEDQKFILRKILMAAEEEKPDAILIAGDIYDKSQPSAEAVNMLDDFLTRISEAGFIAFAVSGNHDSAERIAFGSRLMNKSGIHMSPVFGGRMEKFTLTDEHGPVNIYMLPFVKPLHVKAFYEDLDRNDYTGAIRKVVEDAAIDTSQRNVIIAHQFVTGGERSESEEMIGGLDNVDAEAFGAFDYVALGHLHRPQSVNSGESETIIRYSGTPLKYSFSEINDSKSITVIEMGEKGDINLRYIPLEPMRGMRQIKGTFDELMNKSFWEGTDYRDAYLKITLTDSDLVPDAIRRLRSVYTNILELKYERDTHGTGGPEAEAAAEDKSPAEIFQEFFSRAIGRPMTDVMKEFIDEKLNKVREEDR